MRDDILRSFGKHLRELREKNGLSQEKLAELADLHRNYAGLVERGGANPTLHIADGIGTLSLKTGCSTTGTGVDRGCAIIGGDKWKGSRVCAGQGRVVSNCLLRPAL